MNSLIAVLLSFCVVFSPGNIDIALGEEFQGDGNSNSRMLSKLICYSYISNSMAMMYVQVVEMEKWFSLTIVR